MKSLIEKNISDIQDELILIRNALYNEPEIGLKEYKASRLLMDLLKKHGFKITENYCNLPTAFKALYDSGKDGPTIAFLCEYDALPEMGHGCGHNIIAAIGFGAGCGLRSVIDNIGGRVVVFGTPDEESTSGKIDLVNNHAFDDIDVAIMGHPYPFSEESGVTMALASLQFEFLGRSAHTAQPKEYCRNSLDALVMTYLNINNLKQYIPDANIYGIIDNGGIRPNIIPDYASMKYYIRAKSKYKLDEYINRIINCVKYTAKATEVETRITELEPRADNLVTNHVMSELFNKNYKAIEKKYTMRKQQGYVATSDIGNVSHVVPTIHPWLSIGNNENLALHTVEFAIKTMSDEAKEAMINAAIAMAQTGFDILSSKEILEDIKREFSECSKHEQ